MSLERLRQMKPADATGSTCEWAANEIERLRATVLDILDPVDMDQLRAHVRERWIERTVAGLLACVPTTSIDGEAAVRPVQAPNGVDAPHGAHEANTDVYGKERT